MPAYDKRESSLRNNVKGWSYADAEWILSRHGFVKRKGKRGSHRVFKHPVTRMEVTVFIHGPTLMPYLAEEILERVGNSDRLLRED